MGVCVHVKSFGFASNVVSPGWAVYRGVPILTCSNNNFVLMYYVLVNKFNNEIHNLLQFTILLTKMRICINLFEHKIALFY